MSCFQFEAVVSETNPFSERDLHTLFVCYKKVLVSIIIDFSSDNQTTHFLLIIIARTLHEVNVVWIPFTCIYSCSFLPDIDHFLVGNLSCLVVAAVCCCMYIYELQSCTCTANNATINLIYGTSTTCHRRLIQQTKTWPSCGRRPI